jgi:hypothetical protein
MTRYEPGREGSKDLVMIRLLDHPVFADDVDMIRRLGKE